MSGNDASKNPYAGIGWGWNTHARACTEAIASIGGDPATVGELVAALRACRRVLEHRIAGEHYRDETRAFDKASAVLAKLPENSNED